MWIVDFFFPLIFTLIGCFVLPFLCHGGYKIAAWKVFLRWFVLDGLIVKTSIVQSNFLSHVQCSRTSIKVVQYHWMIAPAKDPEISFLFFSQLTSLK